MKVLLRIQIFSDMKLSLLTFTIPLTTYIIFYRRYVSQLIRGH